jgi:hypothetical protein
MCYGARSVSSVADNKRLIQSDLQQEHALHPRAWVYVVGCLGIEQITTA